MRATVEPAASIGQQLGLFDVPAPAPVLEPVLEPTVLPPAVRGRPEVAYRNPDNYSQAWTGRGKPPRWVTEWVAGGKSLEALRVPGAAS